MFSWISFRHIPPDYERRTPKSREFVLDRDWKRAHPKQWLSHKFWLSSLYACGIHSDSKLTAEPDESTEWVDSFHARTPTRPVWTAITRICLRLSVSHSSTAAICPKMSSVSVNSDFTFVPTARIDCADCENLSEVIELSSETTNASTSTDQHVLARATRPEHSASISPLPAFHRYTVLSSATYESAHTRITLHWLVTNCKDVSQMIPI